MRFRRENDRPTERREGRAARPIQRAAGVAGLGIAAALAMYFIGPCNHETETRQQDEVSSPAPAAQESFAKKLRRAQEREEVLRFIAKATREASSGIDLLAALRKEFPYGALDCQMVSIDPSTLPAQTLSGYGDNSIAKAINEISGSISSVFSLHKLIVEKGGCKADMSKPFKSCPTSLSGEVERLNEGKDALGLARAVKFLESLNLEWLEQPDQDQLFAYNSLSGVYTGMYLDAALKREGAAPDPSCMANNYYALKLLHTARFHLAQLLFDDPNLARHLMHAFSEEQRAKVFRICSLILLERGDPPKFFNSLPADAQKEFIDATDNVADALPLIIGSDAFAEQAQKLEAQMRMEELEGMGSIDEALAEPASP